jgi:predicted phosphodiesterase
VRPLAPADRPLHADPVTLAAQHEVDAVVCLGDVQPSGIETLDRMRLSTLGVFGNLDDEPYMDRFGIEDVHLRRIELDRGPSVCGFETYRRSCGKVATS